MDETPALQSLDSLFWRPPGCDAAPLSLHGHRVTVQRLGELWNEGLTADEICGEWDYIPKEKILAGLAMYLLNRPVFEAIAAADREIAEQLYRQTGRSALAT